MPSRRRLGGGRQVVLEFHEEAVADAAAMRRLRDQLNALGIGLAYDDFGAGQSRLTELADVPPDFIKLDKSLVHGLHESRAARSWSAPWRAWAPTWASGSSPRAIEIPEEAEACLNLGCHFGQGYFFGRPQPVASPGRVDANAEATRQIPVLG